VIGLGIGLIVAGLVLLVVEAHLPTAGVLRAHGKRPTEPNLDGERPAVLEVMDDAA
jgi:hypothetical protein